MLLTALCSSMKCSVIFLQLDVSRSVTYRLTMLCAIPYCFQGWDSRHHSAFTQTDHASFVGHSTRRTCSNVATCLVSRSCPATWCRVPLNMSGTFRWSLPSQRPLHPPLSEGVRVVMRRCADVRDAELRLIQGECAVLLRAQT